MAGSIERVVDAHVHLWDPARADWYPYLAGRQDIGMGDISRMCRLFDQKTYVAESAAWPIQKFVHVAAATPAVGLSETAELEEQAQASGHPDAIIGSVNPAHTVSEMVDALDRQLATSPRFRGVRAPGLPTGPVPPPEVLRGLAERGLVFDLMAHPDELHDAARALAGHDDLTVVVEHAGWPRTDTDDEHELWRAGMAELAGLGPRVHCKVSGLAMPLATMAPSAYRRWVEGCLELFGVDRCLFASNFPVDGLHGTFDELFTTYDELTEHLDPAAREKVFAANAERVYRC